MSGPIAVSYSVNIYIFSLYLGVVASSSSCPGVPASLGFPFPAAYTWVAPPLTGSEAKEACQELGGHLSPFKTQEEANSVLSLRGFENTSFEGTAG